MSWTVDATDWLRQASSPILDGFNTQAARGVLWKLNADFRAGQKLPMRVIYPRPDNETTTFALHRKASSNFAYQTRIAIQGGEAPFKYELITAPVGASIVGEFTRSIDPDTGLTLHTYPDDYGTVTWSNPTGTSAFVVRVTDQSDATVDVTWTVETDETAFVVLDSVNGDDSNLGTWASPLQTFANGLWKNSFSDATYAGKIAVFKDGTYVINQGAVNQNVGADDGIKPLSFLAVGETVIFDTSTGHFFVNTGDVAFVGMEFRGSRSDLADNRIIQVSTKNSNYLFWKLKFSQQTFGTSGNDNPSCIVFMDDNIYGQNIAVVDNEMLTTAAMQLICTFSSDGVLVENNKAQNLDFVASNGATFIHAKDDTKNVTIRFNHLTGSSPNAMIRVSNQQAVGMLAFNQEVNYNYVETTTVDWEGGPIHWNRSAAATPNAANTHSYRNTIVSPTFAHSTTSWNGGDAVKISGTAWVATNLTFSTGFEEVLPVNVQIAATDLNADGSLNEVTGKRTTYLGKLGFEIASSN